VPASLIKDDNCMSASGYLGGDLIEVKLHGFGIAERQDEAGTGSVFGAYGPEQIG
jgi:hypothetical protein